MIKIIVTKTEDVKSVIKKIEESEDNQITLVVPRESSFGEQVKNFEILREASAELDKEIAIESVDENVLALAEANSFASIHPLFRNGRPGHVSDIIPAKFARASRAKKEKAEDKPVVYAGHKKAAKEPVMLHEVEKRESVPVQIAVLKEREEFTKPEFTEGQSSKGRGKKLFALAAMLAVLGVIYFGGERFFARAEITIQMKNTPWQDVSGIVASKNATDVSSAAIPASVLTDKKTTTQFFPASGKSQVSEKAKGKITVINAYSSQPQTLVATTRFQSPDGQIVRLVSQIIVPGAKIQDGKIIPSSLITDVIADKPGADYNIGPMPRLSIPGFKGTPKFDGFYGTLETQLAGGFVGVRPTPTASDIASAKDKTTKILKSIFGTGLFNSGSEDLKILDGATSLSITKLVVDSTSDAQGNFSILGEVTLSAVGFREADVKKWLILKAQKSDPNASFKGEPNLNYSGVQPDFTRGSLKFTVTSDGLITPSFDANSFRDMVLGKTSAEARALILKIPELGDGKLALWPFWLTGLPTDPGRIKVTVE